MKNVPGAPGASSSSICLEGVHKSLTEEEVAGYERRSGHKLPPRYRAFLFRNNGGTPRTPIYRKAGLSLYVQYFFPLALDIEPNLESELRQFPVALSSELLPIALEGSGSYVFLDIASDKILLWNHEDESLRHRVNVRDLTIMEDSIDVFLQRLLPSVSSPKTEADPLESIVKSGKIADLREYVDQHGITARSQQGKTASEWAAIHGKTELLEFCIQNGGMCCGLIHLAARNAQCEAVDLLLKHGVSINERNSEGKTPLGALVVFPEMKKFLVERGGVL